MPDLEPVVRSGSKLQIKAGVLAQMARLLNGQATGGKGASWSEQFVAISAVNNGSSTAAPSLTCCVARPGLSSTTKRTLHTPEVGSGATLTVYPPPEMQGLIEPGTSGANGRYPLDQYFQPGADDVSVLTAAEAARLPLYRVVCRDGLWTLADVPPIQRWANVTGGTGNPYDFTEKLPQPDGTFDDGYAYSGRLWLEGCAVAYTDLTDLMNIPIWLSGPFDPDPTKRVFRGWLPITTCPEE